MRPPSIRNPRSIWDILAVVLIYVGIEYVVLQITGAFLVEQELVVVALLVVVWTMWAFLRILGRYA